MKSSTIVSGTLAAAALAWSAGANAYYYPEVDAAVTASCLWAPEGGAFALCMSSAYYWLGVDYGNPFTEIGVYCDGMSVVWAACSGS